MKKLKEFITEDSVGDKVDMMAKKIYQTKSGNQGFYQSVKELSDFVGDNQMKDALIAVGTISKIVYGNSFDDLASTVVDIRDTLVSSVQKKFGEEAKEKIVNAYRNRH